MCFSALLQLKSFMIFYFNNICHFGSHPPPVFCHLAAIAKSHSTSRAIQQTNAITLLPISATCHSDSKNFSSMHWSSLYFPHCVPQCVMLEGSQQPVKPKTEYFPTQFSCAISSLNSHLRTFSTFWISLELGGVRHWDGDSWSHTELHNGSATLVLVFGSSHPCKSSFFLHHFSRFFSFTLCFHWFPAVPVWVSAMIFVLFLFAFGFLNY